MGDVLPIEEDVRVGEGEEPAELVGAEDRARAGILDAEIKSARGSRHRDTDLRAVWDEEAASCLLDLSGEPRFPMPLPLGNICKFRLNVPFLIIHFLFNPRKNPAGNLSLKTFLLI